MKHVKIIKIDGAVATVRRGWEPPFDVYIWTLDPNIVETYFKFTIN
jgi:hypothetical protein